MTRRPDGRPPFAAAQDLLVGRRPPRIEELFELIHAINPTSRALGERERTEAYAIKARLQSLLIERFGEVLVVEESEATTAVVGLRHRTYAKDACHAVVAELSAAAREWVRYQLDLRRLGPEETARGSKPGTVRRASRAEADTPLPARADAMAQAESALVDWDLERARELLGEALGAGPVEPDDAVGVRAARAMLRLLVEQLMEDAAALALSARLGRVRDEEVRCLLALAEARSGDEARAEALIAGVELVRWHEVVLARARRARARGAFDEAERQIGRVPATSELWPEARAAAAEVARARGEAAGPLEASLGAAVAAGAAESAERLAREVLALHPGSALAQRVLAERRRAAQAERSSRLEAAVERALATGDSVAARAALHELEAIGPARRELGERVAALARAQAARQREAEAEALAAALRSSLDAGTIERLWKADEPVRAAALAGPTGPDLAWVVAIGPVRGKDACAAAAAAASALTRAQALLEAGDVAEAFALAVPHARRFELGPTGRLWFARLHDAREALRRREALERLAQAEAASSSDARHAAELVAALQADDLDPDARRRLAELVRLLASRRRGEDLVGLARASEATGDLLAARATLAELRVVSGSTLPEELRAWDEDLRLRIRSRWVEEDATGPSIARELQDYCFLSGAVARAWLTAGGQRLLLAEAFDDRVFVRVLDMRDPERSRGMVLRVPESVFLGTVHVEADAFLLCGSDHLLALDPESLDVLAWRAMATLHGVPEDTEIDIVAPGGRYLWCRSDAFGGENSAGYVIDRQRWAKAREVDGMIYWPVHGSDPGLVACCDNRRFALHAAHGPRVFGQTGRSYVQAFVTDPLGEGVVALRSEGSIHDPGPSELIATRFARDGTEGHELRLGPTADRLESNVATSLEHGCTFVQYCSGAEGEVLVAVVRNGTALEELWRVPVPSELLLVGDGEGRHVVAFVRAAGTVAVHPLDRTPPRLAAASSNVDWRYLDPRERTCWASENVRALAFAYEAVVPLITPASVCHRLELALASRPGLDTVLAWYATLDGSLEPLLWWHLTHDHGDDPVVCVLRAERLVGRGRWRRALEVLDRIETARLDPGLMCHVMHLRALASLAEGPADATQRWLTAAGELRGACDLSGVADHLAALRAPLEPEPEPRRDDAYGVILRHRRADAALEQGKLGLAIRELDHAAIFSPPQPQGLARLATAYLAAERDDPEFRFRKRRVLHQVAEDLGHRQERCLPLGPATWPRERLAAVQARCHDWLGIRGRPMPMPESDPGDEGGASDFRPAITAAFVYTKGLGVLNGPVPAKVLPDEAVQSVSRARRPALERLADAHVDRADRVAVGLVIERGLPCAAPFRDVRVQLLRETDPDTMGDVEIVVSLDAALALVADIPEACARLDTPSGAGARMPIVVLRRDGVGVT